MGDDCEEEELLREQARFKLQGGRTASATVVRTAPQSAPVDQDSGLSNHEHLLPIVGDVVERRRGDKTVGTSRPVQTIGGFPRVEHRSSKGSRFRLGRQGKAGSDCMTGEDVSLPEPSASGMSDESKDAGTILQGMSAEEIDEARKELLQRLPAKTVEFLRARNELKTKTGKSASSGGAATNDESKMLSKTASDALVPKAPAIAPLVERLRFDMAGRVAELGPEVQQTEDAAALKRDVLRFSHESGFYSVKEACTLARSTDVKQRIFGLRFLQAVLQRCRDGLLAGSFGGRPDIDHCTGPELDVTWIQLWQHAVYVAQVARTVRYALDDEKPKVVVAACGALLALIGGDLNVEGLQGLDPRHPRNAAPRCQVHHMQRAAPDEAHHQQWVSMPLDVGDRRQEALKDGLHSEDGEDADELDIARVDPVSGLLNMRLLQRVCFLLVSFEKDEPLVSASAKRDLVKVLRTLSLAGGDVMRAIARTHRLVDALAAVLPAYHDEPDEIATVALDTLANLVDCVKEWGDSAIRRVARYASNAVLCHPLHSGVARLWRSLQVSGHVFMTLDDMYPMMCLSFDREAFLLAACSCETGNASAAASLSVLNEASIRIEVITRGKFYEAGEDAHGDVAAILQYAQCCWQKFCAPGSVLQFEEEDDDDDKEGEEAKKAKRMQHARQVSEIRTGVVTCWQLAAQQIVRPSDDAPIVACASWGAELASAVTTFMNLTSLMGGYEDSNIGATVASVIEMGRALLNALAASAASFVPLDDPDIIQPWDAPRLQQYADIACLVDAVQMCIGDQVCVAADVINLNLQLLAVLPPGGDLIGLRLLSHVFGTSAKSAIHRGLQLIDERIEDDQCDELRIQALSGLSKGIGYELQGAAGWTSLRSLQPCFAGRRAIMDGRGSVFPLLPGWEFGATAIRADPGDRGDWGNSNAECGVRYRGILSWILGSLDAGVRLGGSAAQQHRALYGMLFGNGSAPWTDRVIRLLSIALFDRLTRSITSEERFQGAWTLSAVRAAAESLASDSFGDLFFTTCFATLFCDRIVTIEGQEEIIAVLKDATALHYLPRLNDLIMKDCICRRSLEPMGFQFLLSVITTHAFEKAMATESFVVDIVMIELVRGAAGDADRLEQVSSRLSRFCDNHCATRYLM